MEYYSVIKKDRFDKFIGKWIHLETIMLSDMSQTHTLLDIM